MSISIIYQYYMDKKVQQGMAQGHAAMICENKNSKSGPSLNSVRFLMHDTIWSQLLL